MLSLKSTLHTHLHTYYYYNHTYWKSLDILYFCLTLILNHLQHCIYIWNPGLICSLTFHCYNSFYCLPRPNHLNKTSYYFKYFYLFINLIVYMRLFICIAGVNGLKCSRLVISIRVIGNIMYWWHLHTYENLHKNTIWVIKSTYKSTRCL